MSSVLKSVPDAPVLLTCAERDVLAYGARSGKPIEQGDAELQRFAGLPVEHLADILCWLRQRRLITADGRFTERGAQALAERLEGLPAIFDGDNLATPLPARERIA